MIILPRFCCLVLSVASHIVVGFIFSIFGVLLDLSKRLSRNKKWVSAHKRAIHKLYSLAIAQVIVTIHFCGNINVNIVLDDMRILEHLKKQPFSVMLVNHALIIDIYVVLTLFLRLGFPSTYKSLGWKLVKNLIPTFGLLNEIAGNIYIGRNSKQAKLKLSKRLNNILSSEGQLTFAYWPEGLIWTPSRYRKAAKFAESLGIEPFKHHLVPRTNGFNLILKKLIRFAECLGKKVHIYNMQIVYGENATIFDWLYGRRINIDIFIEEIGLNEEVRREALDESLQPEDCKACAKFLYDVFRRKDELIEEYKRNGNKFVSAPSGGVLEEAPHLDMLLVWLTSATLTLWLMYYIFGGFVGLATSLAFIAAGVALFLVLSIFIAKDNGERERHTIEVS